MNMPMTPISNLQERVEQAVAEIGKVVLGKAQQIRLALCCLFSGGHLPVRQYDEHAWTEVWMPGQGWLRIDPTAAVAPQRVQRGSNSVLRLYGEPRLRA